ncbi:MotA/TolQ/ExbB proton channel family protein [Vibrio harveyi]|uniref:MotA/TolQ/ExbB proton channel family protein n=1 Tax=Vibrio harveyi TaxID=669 RepID=UPI0040692BCA
MKNFLWKPNYSHLLSAILLVIFNIAPAVGANTIEERSGSDTLQEIFKRVEQSSKEDIQRYKQLKSQKSHQLQEVNGQVESLQLKLQELNSSNAKLEEAIIALQEKLSDKQKQVQLAQADIEEVIELTSAQQNNFISNNKPLATWFESQTLLPVQKNNFSIASINNLWLAMIQQISASSRVNVVKGEILLPNGNIEKAPVQLVGAFSQFSQDYGWLKFDGARQQWRQVSPQPQLDITQGQWAVDPSFGFGFDVLANQPKWYESYLAAGMVGALIVVLAIIGFSIGIARLITLTKEKQAVKKQASQLDELSENNMLGRVLMQLKNCNAHQQMEDVVDANVSREMPWLHRGIGTLAVLAAIAPLMGLLGTVGGMIETFSVITSQGVTDGELLSGGIAEALLTTKLGLLVAVPLLILHCLVKTQAQQLAEIIEHQVTSLVVDIRYGNQGTC